jgi:hypothetical protein
MLPEIPEVAGRNGAKDKLSFIERVLAEKSS